ncbi:hypothetical protein GW17_00027850 [Ensete ventricosum]|nr:hypothetical protein GW17_00027850 [Ensete ventricosum]
MSSATGFNSVVVTASFYLYGAMRWCGWKGTELSPVLRKEPCTFLRKKATSSSSSSSSSSSLVGIVESWTP